MSSPYLVSCQRQCRCWSISVFPRYSELFLFPSSIHPFLHYSYILFFSVGWVLSSPTCGVLVESLPDCKVLVINHHCFRPIYRSWDFTDMKPTSYKFGSVDHCRPATFLHKPVFGIESFVFLGFSFIVSLCFPSGHIDWFVSHDRSDSGNCHFEEFREAAFEIYSLPMQLRIQFLDFW